MGVKLRQSLKGFIKRAFWQEGSRTPEPSPMKWYVWSIGIYFGRSPVHFFSPDMVSNPILTYEDVSDVQAAYVADPFMLKLDHTWHMFFEVMNRRTKKGEIGIATSRDGVNWTYEEIVLTESFHISYPYVFEWENEYYMIPETHQAGSVRLYKASKFPKKWRFIKSLLAGPRFSDSSIFRFNDKWWLFTETNPDCKFDTLRLYYSEDLMGPWLEHPKSPVIEGNPHIARPAGRVLVMDERIIRYTQDCYPDYGTRVYAFEIQELTTERFREKAVSEDPVLKFSGAGWNASGMHQIDPHLLEDGNWIACVDGYCWVNA